ncbi:MAG: hypothetical protein JW797_08770 [Bradymonadales bacterium]|nr:hypothetical protein [Bradymonadales bacterium]
MRTIRLSCCLLSLLAGLWGCNGDEAVGSDAGGDMGSDAPTCSSPRILCEGECINPNTDAENCGRCGNRCDTGEICVNGDCVPNCATGQVLCGDACVYTATDPNHCGRCGNRCPPDQECSGGICRCPENLSECPGGCVDLDKDESNCGQCSRACGSNEVCEDGDCVSDCPQGWEVCQGACVDVQTDERYCGDCNTRCGTNQVCEGGDCVCTGDLTECGDVCVDTNTNPSHCGQCDDPCPEGTICQGGDCVCTGGLVLCDGSCVDVQTNVNYCGNCETECDPGELCVEGDCTTGCPEGRTPCGDTCVNTQDDPAHCGDCITVCRADQDCVSGVCQCGTGFGECDGVCVDTQTNPNYCGNCTTACDPDEVCSGGLCSCREGLTRCGEECVDTSTSNSHCGECDHSCDTLELCSGGHCVCRDGYSRCGTECVLLSTDPAHCGQCFNDCEPNEVCTAGNCELTCAEGLTPCDGACVDTDTDEDHCGECGRDCTYVQECLEGDCTCVNDYYEYGYSDSFGGAAKLDPMVGWPWRPHFDDLRLCGEESDWYVVYLPTDDSSLEIEVLGDCSDEVLPILTVYDIDLSEVDTDDGETDICPSLQLVDLASGWYWIVLENTVGQGAYSLYYRIHSTSEVEPNNSPDQATGPFSDDFQVVGTITPSTDVDTYLLWVPLTTDLLLWTDDSLGSCTTDTVIRVTDLWGEILGEDDDDGIGLCSELELTLHRGYYFVSVNSWWNLSTGSYVLHGDAYYHFEIEPNGEVYLADGPFGSDFGVQGVVFPAYDRDRYKIVLDEPATIVAEVVGNEDGCMLDSRIELWSETELLGEDDDFDYGWELENLRGFGWCSRIDPFSTSEYAPDQSWAEDLPAGTYYLIVAGYGSQIGAYNLNVRIVE